MSDPNEQIIAVVLITLIVSVYFTIRCCADAVLHGQRNWWKKAIYKAQQRQQYAEFCKELDEVSDLERMGVK